MSLRFRSRALRLRVAVSAEEVEGLVLLGADHPAVVAGRNAEEVARVHDDLAAVAHSEPPGARKHEPDMLDLAEFSPCRGSKMLGPAPSGLVHRSSDLETADSEQFKPSERERPHLGRICKIEDGNGARHASIVPSLQPVVLDVLAVSAPLEERARLYRPTVLPGVEALHATFVRHRYPPHVHDYWVIACVDRGAATFELEGHRHTAAAGSMFVIPPAAAHTGESATDGGYTYRVLYVDWPAFTWEVDPPHDESSVLASPISYDGPRRYALDRLHRALLLPGRSMEQGEALADLNRALRDVAAPLTRRPRPRRHPAVARAEAFINEHWQENFTLHDLAAAADVSPFHLVRIFHRHMGMPPSSYRRALRIQAAQKLLRRGQPTVDVAVACGFYDQAHLTRHFKAVTGVTPMRYAHAA